MISLLPTKEKRRLTRNYLVRLLSVICILAAFVVLVAAILELPSYIYLTRRLSGVVPSGVSENDSAQTVTEPQEKRVNEIATRLSPEDSDLVFQIESLKNVVAGAVRLDSLTLEEGVWKVVGWSPTRADLLALTESLEGQSWISEAQLPVEALARASDISFTLTVTPQ